MRESLNWSTFMLDWKAEAEGGLRSFDRFYFIFYFFAT